MVTGLYYQYPPVGDLPIQHQGPMIVFADEKFSTTTTPILDKGSNIRGLPTEHLMPLPLQQQFTAVGKAASNSMPPPESSYSNVKQHATTAMETCFFYIPRSAVASVIGRRGERVKQIQVHIRTLLPRNTHLLLCNILGCNSNPDFHKQVSRSHGQQSKCCSNNWDKQVCIIPS
jgi:hypothetical protein